MRCQGLAAAGGARRTPGCSFGGLNGQPRLYVECGSSPRVCHAVSMSVGTGLVDGAGEPLRNHALVEAMRAVSVQDTPGRRALLFRLLLESTVVVATPEMSGEPGMRTAEAGERLSLFTFRDGDETVLPVFTTAAAVLAWRPGRTAITALPARA